VADQIFWNTSRFVLCGRAKLMVDTVDGNGKGDRWEVRTCEIEEVV